MNPRHPPGGRRRRRSLVAAPLLRSIAATGTFFVLGALAASAQENDWSAVSATLNLSSATKYFFRGLEQEDQGAIFQPSFEVGLSLWEHDGFMKSLGFTIGSWNSIHSGPTGSGSGSMAQSPKAWYESDFYTGFNAEIAGGVTMTATYAQYTSPNDLWSTITEVDLGVNYDDAELWKPLGFGGLQPSLMLGRELHNQADQASNPHGTHPGTYLGIGVQPSFCLGTLCDDDQSGCLPMPITLKLPADVGLSLANYYEKTNGRDETFGYADVGAFVSLPLTFVPERYGRWQFSIGVQALFLGETCRQQNHGDGFDVVGTAVLTLKF